jgi:hypothetical protein
MYKILTIVLFCSLLFFVGLGILVWDCGAKNTPSVSTDSIENSRDAERKIKSPKMFNKLLTVFKNRVWKHSSVM